jgi:hypothetical protein
VLHIAKRVLGKRAFTVLPAIGLAAIAVAGCKATGGGFISSATEAKAAYFGFTWNETDHGAVVSGSWHDGWVKFKLDGGIVYGSFGPCASSPGEYVSTSKANPGTGSIYATICDYGEPGPTNGDSITIQLTGGPYDGYSDGGTLQGGNLQLNSK